MINNENQTQLEIIKFAKNLDNLLFAVFVDGCELDLKELIRLYGDYMSEIYKENDNNSKFKKLIKRGYNYDFITGFIEPAINHKDNLYTIKIDNVFNTVKITTIDRELVDNQLESIKKAYITQNSAFQNAIKDIKRSLIKFSITNN